MENNEEMEIENEVEKKPSRFKNINVELVFFLILGFLLGIVIKTEAVKRVTVGFDDYKISSLKQGYDFNQLQQNLEQQNANSIDNGASNSNNTANSDNAIDSGNSQSDNSAQGN